MHGSSNTKASTSLRIYGCFQEKGNLEANGLSALNPNHHKKYVSLN